MGTRTGRAAGFCAGFDMPGYTNPVQGCGFGMGGGRGRGSRSMSNSGGLPGWARFGSHGAPYGPHNYADIEMQKQLLKKQAEDLQAELELVKKRLTEVENKTATE